ncbi:hypothetical protein VCNHCC008D_003341B, partial [Vibrio cholerae O1 str. NHCC-008D]
VSLRENH